MIYIYICVQNKLEQDGLGNQGSLEEIKDQGEQRKQEIIEEQGEQGKQEEEQES